MLIVSQEKSHSGFRRRPQTGEIGMIRTTFAVRPQRAMHPEASSFFESGKELLFRNSVSFGVMI